jgi:hypothetical protein
MAIFDNKSRYVRPALEPYPAVDVRGRPVMALPMREPVAEGVAGVHLTKQGQRLDHLAGAFLQDPNGYWRIAEANEAVLPEALTEAERLKIPSPIR